MTESRHRTFATSRILVVGDVILDRYWFGDVERISPESPVPVVRVDRTEERLGGAANVARNMTALGGQSGLLAVIGQDEAGRAFDRLLQASNIEPHIHWDAELATTVKVRVIGRRQQMLRADFESQPKNEVLLAHLGHFESLLPRYEFVVLSDYGKGGLTHIEQMIDSARAAGRPVLVDPKGDDYSQYRGATLLTPNRAELREVIGRWRSESELTDKVQALRDHLQLQAIVLTRSEEGMTLFTDEGAWTVPAQAREVYDVSGAGDTVIAVLAVVMAAGAPLREAVELANRAGGIVVGKLGTSTVTSEELFGARQ